MTREEEDALHLMMIRQRRELAPGHWSNSDIDCLLRAVAAERAARDAKLREYVDWVLAEGSLRQSWFDKRRTPPGREP